MPSIATSTATSGSDAKQRRDLLERSRHATRKLWACETGVPYTASDSVHIECDYDNTADNQPVINGMRTPVRTVTFGEKTLNEMCLHYLWLRFDYETFATANGLL
jgi:hypothetical protein